MYNIAASVAQFVHCRSILIHHASIFGVFDQSFAFTLFLGCSLNVNLPAYTLRPALHSHVHYSSFYSSFLSSFYILCGHSRIRLFISTIISNHIAECLATNRSFYFRICGISRIELFIEYYALCYF